MKKCCMIAAAALVGLGGAGAASADTVLQFDVNSLTATASGPFGLGFTGSVTLAKDGNSTLTDLLIDGSAQNIAPGQLAAFSGVINLAAGGVTGGSFTITDIGGASYTALIANGVGSVGTAVGQTGPFTIDGLTFSGAFSNLAAGNKFAGVDVSAWAAISSINGSFLQFKFGPDQQGVDSDADADIFAVVPMPAPAALGFVGLAGLGMIRRRRV